MVFCTSAGRRIEIEHALLAVQTTRTLPAAARHGTERHGRSHASRPGQPTRSSAMRSDASTSSSLLLEVISLTTSRQYGGHQPCYANGGLVARDSFSRCRHCSICSDIRAGGRMERQAPTRSRRPAPAKCEDAFRVVKRINRRTKVTIIPAAPPADSAKISRSRLLQGSGHGDFSRGNNMRQWYRRATAAPAAATRRFAILVRCIPSSSTVKVHPTERLLRRSRSKPMLSRARARS